MVAERFQRPDVLVLAGGGILGEAWMSGLLAGLGRASGVDFTRTEFFVGTSAGSIVAATLAAGVPPRGPRAGEGGAHPGEPRRERAERLAGGAIEPDRPAGSPLGALARGLARRAGSTAAPLTPLALALGAPGGALLRGSVLARIPAGSQDLEGLHARMGGLDARFDGRLRVVCVDRHRGRRVVFGSPGAPRATVADAVAASCSIPGVFRPVAIGGREYVDGGAWSFTNLDVAPVGRDTEVLCLNPSGSLRGSLSSPLEAMRSVSRAVAAVEAAALRARGARVRIISPAPPAARLMGINLMDPGPRRAVRGAAYRQGLELGRA